MKRQGFIVFVLGLLVLALCCCGGRSIPSRALANCEKGKIETKDRVFSAEETLSLVGAKDEKVNEAVSGISRLVNKYFDDKAGLCDRYVQGELSELEYNSRSRRLSERFSALMELNEDFPARQVRPSEVPFYMETLSELAPDAKARSVEFGLYVIGKGKEISNGGIMFGGDEVRLVVDVSILAYLYVFLVDTSGSLSLLYPTSFDRGENPVQKRVEIPGGENNVLVLDENKGKEKFIVFVQTEPSKAVEAAISNAQKPGGNPAFVADILLRCAKSRASLMKNKSPKRYFSPFGQASAVFEIDHR